MYDSQTNHLCNRIASNIDSTNISTVYSWHQRTFLGAAPWSHFPASLRPTEADARGAHLVSHHSERCLRDKPSLRRNNVKISSYGWVAKLWRHIKSNLGRLEDNFPSLNLHFRGSFFWGCYKWSSNCSANRVLEAQGRHIFLSSGRQQGNFYTGRKSAEKPSKTGHACGWGITSQ